MSIRARYNILPGTVTFGAAIFTALTTMTAGFTADAKVPAGEVASDSRLDAHGVPTISKLHEATDLRAEEGVTAMTIAALIGGKTDNATDQGTSEVAQIMGFLRNKEFDKALEGSAKLIQKNPNDPAGYNLQGAAYLGKNDAVSARKSFEKALSVRPDHGPSLMNLAQLDVRSKDMASARKRYQTILTKDPKNVPAMLGMANVEALSGKDKESLAWLEKAKAANPEALGPRLALGAHYIRSKNSKKALAELTDALRLHPDNAELLNLLGKAQLADGQKAAAIDTYKKLVSLRPASAVAHFELAIAYINNGSSSEAEASLKKALQLKPDFVKAIEVLADLEIRAGRSEEAMKLAKDLQKADPKSPAGLAFEGDLLMMQKRYAEATKAYQGALALRQTGTLVVRLHAAQTGAGNGKEADANLQRWLNDHPDDLAALRYLAQENTKAGRDKQAIEQYQRILQKEPNDAATLNNLAILYDRAKDPRALATAEQAYKLMPESPTVADTLGWILAGQGKTARGLELIQKAAAKAPTNTEIRYHLAVVLAKSGDKGKARTELETLLAGDKNFPERQAARQLLDRL